MGDQVNLNLVLQAQTTPLHFFCTGCMIGRGGGAADVSAQGFEEDR
jgi:hypothetical protein